MAIPIQNDAGAIGVATTIDATPIDIRPQPGEIYQVLNIWIQNNDAANAANCVVNITDGTSKSRIHDASLAALGTVIVDMSVVAAPLYTSNSLYISVGQDGSSTDITFYIGYQTVES